MDYETYWHGDSWLCRAYHEAHKLRMQQINANAYLQGAYIYEALLDASPLLHAFAKKGTKPVPYRDAPYPMFGEKKEEKPAMTEEQEALRAKIYMRQMMRHFKKNYTKPEPQKPAMTEEQKSEPATGANENNTGVGNDVQTPCE